jgi:3-deoxy-D-manno-octulosonic-acid transferase
VIWRAGYRLLLWLAFPWVLARLWWRGREEPGYRRHIGERFGFYGERPSKPVVWLHAVSVGETRASEPLARALLARHPGSELLVTQMTATGRETARAVFGPDARLAYLPYDYPFSVRRFLRHFRPRVGLIMETEVWFNLVRECEVAGVPLLLVNARMSERSRRAYAAVAPLARQAFAHLGAVAAQSADDAARLRALGAPRVQVTGNLKFDVTAPAGMKALAAEFRARFGSRRVLLAASTREGEEDALVDALERNSIGDALTVIVPRHPQRFDEVAQALARRGLAYVRRSAGRPVAPDCRYVLGDSMGEMAAYYQACDVALIGGSLLPYGGQNLIEACALGVPAMFGPHTFNFAQAADAAVAAGAALRVETAEQAAVAARALLQDAGRRARMAQAGLRFCAEHRGAAERTLALVETVLAHAREPGAAAPRPV